MNSFFHSLKMRMISFCLLCVMTFQLTGCGTLFYSERKEQPKGTADINVVLLDAIGLLFFLIPGLIAFAVDYSNNTIYLPPGHPRATSDSGQGQLIQLTADQMNKEGIELALRQSTGTIVHLDGQDVQVYDMVTQKQVDQVDQYAFGK